jgi:hypothetical protein
MNYNHCLCVWRPEALAHVYDQAVCHLVSARHYPESILDLKYDPDFLIRGVSLDTHRGVVCKLTFLHSITPSKPPAARDAYRDEDASSRCSVVRGASDAQRGRAS